MPRRRERRRSPAQQVLRRPAASRLFAGIGRPLRRALDLLGSRSRDVRSAWRRLLRRLNPGRNEYETISRLDFLSHWRRLRSSGYEAYTEALAREGQSLARRGVPEEHAIAAAAFYLEGCLSQLLAGRDQRAMARALARLTLATQRLLAAAYARERGAGWGSFDDKERQRLSRDLHDEVGADLVVLKLYVEMISAELTRGGVVPASRKLEEAMVLIAHAIESVRRLTLDLGPAILEQIGFLSAVKLYARQFSARTGLSVQVQEAPMPPSLPASHETALYRVLQGALSNVAKHARARSVHVTVGSVRDAVVIMIIEDDGLGFDVARVRQSFGLTAMRDRIESLGGRLHVESRTARTPGGRSGTRIEIDLPLKERDGT